MRTTTTTTIAAAASPESHAPQQRAATTLMTTSAGPQHIGDDCNSKTATTSRGTPTLYPKYLLRAVRNYHDDCDDKDEDCSGKQLRVTHGAADNRPRLSYADDDEHRSTTDIGDDCGSETTTMMTVITSRAPKLQLPATSTKTPTAAAGNQSVKFNAASSHNKFSALKSERKDGTHASEFWPCMSPEFARVSKLAIQDIVENAGENDLDPTIELILVNLPWSFCKSTAWGGRAVRARGCAAAAANLIAVASESSGVTTMRKPKGRPANDASMH
ncbi:hypothetical protein EDB83DRAFT_2322886 [Lactarius deliciosus]|nr:hypothetical protein EDB83DRAFT_2322869 [Lactarius deliciosus]KAH9008930.1 hypothetical protein EDB83DRAFT_2322886 [Lactarius deliciosus]